MKAELQEKLYNDFPLLYRQRHLNMMQTCMVWGFECDSGWFDLLYDLSSKLEKLIIKFQQENPNTDPEYLPSATQVKEKYGTLRFYMGWSTDEMEDLISEAENASYHICEKCGNGDAQSNTNGWISVRCRDCWDSSISYDETTKQHEAWRLERLKEEAEEEVNKRGETD